MKAKQFARAVSVTVKGRQEGAEYSVAKCYNTQWGQCTWPGFASEDHDLAVKYGREHQCG